MLSIKEVLVRQNKDWSKIDYTTSTVMDLLTKYDAVLISVTPSNSTEVQQYALNKFPGIYKTNNRLLLSEYIANYAGGLPLAISPIKSLSTAKWVKYHSLWNFGLQADRGMLSPTFLGGDQVYAPDIVISKPDNYPNALAGLANKVLYLVNGIVFFETLQNNKAYLVGASAALDRYDSQQLSIIDFSALGGFERILLTTNNVTLFHSGDKDAVIHVELPHSIKNLTPLLVRNGNLHYTDSSYSIVSDTTIAIRLEYRKIVSEAVNVPASEVNWVKPVNVDALGYDLSTVDPIQYLTNGNSALLLLNTNELSIHKEFLGRTDFVGKYTSAAIPTGILYLEDGSIGDYNVTAKAHYGNEISTTTPKLIHALKDTSPVHLLKGINNASTAFPSTTSMAQIVDLYVL